MRGDDQPIGYDIDHRALDEDAEYFRRVTAALTYLKDAEAKLIAQRTPVESNPEPQLPQPRACDELS